MRAARECAATARETVMDAGDEEARRPVGLTESRENAFIIALTMKATKPPAFATLEAANVLYFIGFYRKTEAGRGKAVVGTALGLSYAHIVVGGEGR